MVYSQPALLLISLLVLNLTTIVLVMVMAICDDATAELNTRAALVTHSIFQ